MKAQYHLQPTQVAFLLSGTARITDHTTLSLKQPYVTSVVDGTSLTVISHCRPSSSPSVTTSCVRQMDRSPYVPVRDYMLI